MAAKQRSAPFVPFLVLCSGPLTPQPSLNNRLPFFWIVLAVLAWFSSLNKRLSVVNCGKRDYLSILHAWVFWLGSPKGLPQDHLVINRYICNIWLQISSQYSLITGHVYHTNTDFLFHHNPSKISSYLSFNLTLWGTLETTLTSMFFHHTAKWSCLFSPPD